MIRIVLVTLFFGFAFSIHGQTHPNPFDLKYRHQTDRKPILQNKSKPAIDSTIICPKVLGQTNPVSRREVELNKTDSTTSGLEINNSSSGLKSNPFEVKESKGGDSSASDVNKTDVVIQQPGEVVEGHGNTKSKGIQIFFILLSLLFLIFIVNVERNFVRDLWRVISNENYSSLHLRNQRNTMRQILLIMGYMVFIFQAGIFFFQVLINFNYQGMILDTVWACIAFVLVIYIIRHTMISYLRWLFNNDKEMTLYGFDISIFNITVGLVLLPINVILNFGPENLYKPLIIIGILVIGIAYLMRQLRWLLTARQLIVNSLFLFFVYLCAVEIFPLWAISKFFW